MRNLNYIDIHCHLQADIFSTSRKSLLTEACSLGIQCICNATSPDDWLEVANIASAYPGVYSALGIHPWYIPEGYQDKLSQLASWNEKIVAIGETGLDSTFSKTPMKTQLESFYRHIEIADELNLPIICHCIRAFDELIRAVKAFKPRTPLILHGFNGSMELAKSLSKFGCLFSIGGTATYPFSKKRQRMLNYIFSNRLIMLETDAPDIPPAGTDYPNLPANIPMIAQAVASYLDIPAQQLAKQTTELAGEIFSIFP